MNKEGFLVSNCYIVGCEETGKGMVIDPSAKTKVILKTAKNLGLSISTIVVTHTHPDHIPRIADALKQAGAVQVIKTILTEHGEV